MTTTPQERAEELSKAYRELINHSFAVIETGWEQITAASNLITAAVDTEKDKTGKTWEAAVKHAQSRNEKLGDILNDPAALKQETKELFDQLIEGEKSIFQSWTEISEGFEKRQEALLQGLSEGNLKIVASSKIMAKSAAMYSEAFLEWSREAAVAMSSNIKS